MTQTEINRLVRYSKMFNKSIDSLLKKLSKDYTHEEAKEIIIKAFNISLHYT